MANSILDILKDIVKRMEAMWAKNAYVAFLAMAFSSVLIFAVVGVVLGNLSRVINIDPAPAEIIAFAAMFFWIGLWMIAMVNDTRKDFAAWRQRRQAK